MKTLVAEVVISTALGFSAASFADTQVFGVKLPAGQNTVEVGHRVMGSYVETNYTSFYTSPKEMNVVENSVKENGADDEYIVVFGVKVPVNSRI